MNQEKDIVEKVSRTLVEAGSTFLPDKKRAYERAIEKESNPQAKWVLETILENAEVAEKNKSPLCDDTGIPHLLLEIGKNRSVTGLMIESIKEGIREGLRMLPGRPMAIKGNDNQRIDQSGGLSSDPGDLESAPIQIRYTEKDEIKLHILMFGGGPAIRGKTYRVFHKHDVEVVKKEIIEWAKQSVAELGCTPCTLGIGIGRSAYEASSLMVQALVDGNYDEQSEFEQDITDAVNQAKIGALGLKGDVTVIGTFAKVGPQRASGVRIVCLRPCCCFEPRIATVEL